MGRNAKCDTAQMYQVLDAGVWYIMLEDPWIKAHGTYTVCQQQFWCIIAESRLSPSIILRAHIQAACLMKIILAGCHN